MPHTTAAGRGRIHGWIVDGAVVGCAVALGLLSVLVRVVDPPADLADWVLPVDAGVGLLGCLALGLRRRYPLALAAATIGLSAFSEVASIPAVIMVFTVAIHCSLRATVVAATASLAAMWILQLWRPDPTAPGWLLASWIGTVLMAAVGWGLLIRSRRQLIASLRERAAGAEVEARLRVERGRLEARETLAREMHDVLGHRLSLLSVNAGALTYHRGADPGDISRAAEAIRENAHRALQDLREVIGVLRAPDGEVPLPGVVDLAELIEETTEAGTPVALRDDPGVTTARHELPTAVGRAVYRLVQEGLTNARKHAPGAPIVVAITGGPGDRLDVEVINERSPDHDPPPAPAGSGAGLRGLTERAALVGGQVDYGPTDGAGWRIGMRIPWPT